jgi:hypothetical protein
MKTHPRSPISHLRSPLIEHTRAPITLSRRTAVLIAACLLAGGCTASTWLHLLITTP